MLTTPEYWALEQTATELVAAPAPEEVTNILTISQFEPASYRLALVKGLMVRLLQAEQRVMQNLVAAVRFIETQELWRGDRDADGRSFRSMSHYLPHLLNELKAQGYTDGLGIRQMRTWLAAERVLVAPGHMTWEDVQEVGIGTVEKVLQATNYNAKTGEMAAVLDADKKKLTGPQALKLLAEVREDRDLWTVDKVAQVADERRGVTRQRVHIDWARDAHNHYYIYRVALFRGDDVTYGSRHDCMTREEARQVMKLLNATSNLDEGYEQ